MNFFKNIISFFKKIFIKNETSKMIESSSVNNTLAKNNNFTNSLKVSTPKHKKPNVETPTCIGDGLGIQPKISF